MPTSDRPYALDIRDRDNLDEEMQTLVDGIEKKYGFKCIVKADKNFHQEYYEVVQL